MKYFSDETRRRMSIAAKERCKTTEFLARVHGYWKPFCTTEELHQLYVIDGMSQIEIAGLYGVSAKRVVNSMKRYGITPRRAVKRKIINEVKLWQNHDISYKGFHLRLNRLRGSPKYCELCHTTNPLKFYDWANMTGRYDDPTDYKRLCRSCHWKLDKIERNFRGATGHRCAQKEVLNAGTSH